MSTSGIGWSWTRIYLENLDHREYLAKVLTCGLMNLANIGNLITYCFERYSNQMTMVFQEKFRSPRTPKSPLATSNHQGLSRVPYIGQAENVPTDFLTIVAT
ncbi:hypothetical protein PABG_12187 [Paracoccidioides brasiliensis Pb03]|nr:hypothetical protein PABG_12187 [Paracoccidioides brasiliensis Pb03]